MITEVYDEDGNLCQIMYDDEIVASITAAFLLGEIASSDEAAARIVREGIKYIARFISEQRI